MEGTHDFTQFASIGHKDYEVSGVKTLTSMQVQRVTGGLEMVFSGTGFLYNQCRHMAGCLISVGKGAMSIEAVQELLFIGRQGGTFSLWCGTPQENLASHKQPMSSVKAFVLMCLSLSLIMALPAA